MVVNGKTLLDFAPIKSMLTFKQYEHGVSYGFSEAGYDIRIKQNISLDPENRFSIASAIEEFSMPNFLMGIVHDKSTWARRGLSVFNTVIEPGWKGFLTLELVYHGPGTLHISAGSGIAQVIFHEVTDPIVYRGRYQNQEDRPVAAISA